MPLVRPTPFKHGGVFTVRSYSGDYQNYETIRDADNRIVLLVQHHIGKQEGEQLCDLCVDALNEYVGKHYRRSDPGTSREAFESSSHKLVGWRNAIWQIIMRMGETFTDEELYGKVCEFGTKITEARVRHIRLELQRMGFIKRVEGIYGTTATGRHCCVYRGIVEGKYDNGESAEVSKR